MKKVLLIQPLWLKDTQSIFRYLYGVFPPLGLAMMASILEKNGHHVKILDCTALNIKSNNILRHIKEDYDVIGLTAFSQSAEGSYRMAKLIKNKFPNTTVAMGGIHSSAMPEEVIQQEGVDICVRNEGEETIQEIVDGLPVKNILGITYKNKTGKIIHNADRTTIKDLDQFPMPAYHLLPMDKYRSVLGIAIKEPSIGLMISRGCPGRCEYCFPNSLGTRVRMKSPQKILEEILLLKNKYGFKEIDFYDDTFTVFKNKIEEVCHLLIKNKVNIAWSALTRVDYVTEDLLKLMKKAGCHQLMYGIEAGSDRVRKELGKGLRTDLKKAIDMTHRVGISVRATYMIGNYTETKKDIENTIKLAKKLNTAYAIFNITTPLPGTALYKRLDKEGRITSKDWKKYDFFNVVFKHPNLKKSEIIKYYKRANLTYYLRFRMIPHYLKLLTSYSQIKILFRMAWGVLRSIMDWTKS